MLVEIFGLLNLFGNMFPMLLAIGRSLPVVGDIIKGIEGEVKGSGRGRGRGDGDRGGGSGSGDRGDRRQQRYGQQRDGAQSQGRQSYNPEF